MWQNKMVSKVAKKFAKFIAKVDQPVKGQLYYINTMVVKKLSSFYDFGILELPRQKKL